MHRAILIVSLIISFFVANRIHYIIAIRYVQDLCATEGGLRINRMISPPLDIVLSHRSKMEEGVSLADIEAVSCNESPSCTSSLSSLQGLAIVDANSPLQAGRERFVLYEDYLLRETWFPQIVSSGWKLYDPKNGRIIASDITFGFNGDLLSYLPFSNPEVTSDSNFCHSDSSTLEKKFPSYRAAIFGAEFFSLLPNQSLIYSKRERAGGD